MSSSRSLRKRKIITLDLDDENNDTEQHEEGETPNKQQTTNKKIQRLKVLISNQISLENLSYD
jgi:hypothetical protein